MEKLIINGGTPLRGKVQISGMKNAALPIIIASILTDDVCVIENLPAIIDVSLTLTILERIGCHVRMLNSDTVEIDSRGAAGGITPVELVSQMRGSSYFMGVELGRWNECKVGYPGGCDFGVRAIDQHIKAFEALGASVSVDGGYVRAKAVSGLHGTNIYFDMVTVGGTINAMLAAVTAKGTTVIENAAHEPHIVDTANFLNTCGAHITGAGTDTIKIRGVEKLHGCTYAIIPDMIEAGTYMIAAAATGGALVISNVIPKHLESISAKLEEMGVLIEEYDDSVYVTRSGKLNHVNVKTLPYPGFPTDMQPQMGTLMCLADGMSYLSETVIENRFKYVNELQRMGANIRVTGHTAIFDGGTPLTGAKVRAVDLRAGAALVIAGLTVSGVTEVSEIDHIERGYENIVGKLTNVGADIRKVIFSDTAVQDEA